MANLKEVKIKLTKTGKVCYSDKAMADLLIKAKKAVIYTEKATKEKA